MAKSVGTALNLVAARKHSVTQTRLLAAKVQFIFGILLAVYLGALILVVLINGGVQLKHRSILDGIKNEELKLAQLRSKEELYYLVKQKLGYMDGLVGEEWAYRKAFEQLVATRPEHMAYTSAELAIDDERTLLVTGEAPNYLALQDFYTYVKALPDPEMVQTATVDGLSRSETGTYSLDTYIVLSKEY